MVGGVLDAGYVGGDAGRGGRDVVAGGGVGGLILALGGALLASCCCWVDGGGSGGEDAFQDGVVGRQGSTMLGAVVVGGLLGFVVAARREVGGAAVFLVGVLEGLFLEVVEGFLHDGDGASQYGLKLYADGNVAAVKGHSWRQR